MFDASLAIDGIKCWCFNAFCMCIICIWNTINHILCTWFNRLQLKSILVRVAIRTAIAIAILEVAVEPSVPSTQTDQVNKIDDNKFTFKSHSIEFINHFMIFRCRARMQENQHWISITRLWHASHASRSTSKQTLFYFILHIFRIDLGDRNRHFLFNLWIKCSLFVENKKCLFCA